MGNLLLLSYVLIGMTVVRYSTLRSENWQKNGDVYKRQLISRLNDKETELYLENRREKGFTVIQTVILDELDDMDVSSNGEPTRFSKACTA